MRLSQVARKLNVGLSTIAEHLETKGFEVEHKPNAKISMEQFEMLAKEFASSAMDKEEASSLTIGQKHSDNLVIDSESDTTAKKRDEEEEIFIKNMSAPQEEATEAPAEPPAVEAEPPAVEEEEQEEEKTPEPAPTKTKLQGIKVVGKIDLDTKKEEQKEEVEEPEEPQDEAVEKEAEPEAPQTEPEKEEENQER